MSHPLTACLFLLLPVGALAQAPIEGDWAQVTLYRSANAGLLPSSRARVVFMGDSITQGWGAEPFFKSHPEYLNRGISGQTTPQLVVRFRADVIALKPAVVHIMGGTNDVAENTGPETDAEIQGYLISMVELARASGITVVLASIPPAADFPWRPGLNPTPRINRLNAWIEGYAAAHGIVLSTIGPRLQRLVAR